MLQQGKRAQLAWYKRGQVPSAHRCCGLCAQHRSTRATRPACTAPLTASSGSRPCACAPPRTAGGTSSASGQAGRRRLAVTCWEAVWALTHRALLGRLHASLRQGCMQAGHPRRPNNYSDRMHGAADVSLYSSSAAGATGIAGLVTYGRGSTAAILQLQCPPHLVANERAWAARERVAAGRQLPQHDAVRVDVRSLGRAAGDWRQALGSAGVNAAPDTKGLCAMPSMQRCPKPATARARPHSSPSSSGLMCVRVPACMSLTWVSAGLMVWLSPKSATCRVGTMTGHDHSVGMKCVKCVRCGRVAAVSRWYAIWLLLLSAFRHALVNSQKSLPWQ